MIRQVIKKLINPSTLLLKQFQMGYATDAKNLFTLPKKQLINPSALCEVSSAITEAYTVRMLAYLFRDNIKFFLDLHVASMYEHIYSDKLQIDDTMYSVIIPITIEYINAFTIQNAQSLGQITYCAAKLNLQHEGLWSSILNKLDQGNVYRYLSLEQTAKVLHALVQQGKFINHPLITKLSNVVAQQKAFYTNFPQLLALINETNQILSRKGETTLKITQAYQQIA